MPCNREEWDECSDEMTSLCAFASTKTIIPEEFIRDRIDIDNPLEGYQMRHELGGWLQGFILWTTFTTWTHYLKWDLSHAKSGIRNVQTNEDLSMELEEQPRSGDPLQKGVIWPTIAEISIVGGLKCGSYLMRLAENDILEKNYDYIVLQATQSSQKFYE